MLSKIQPILTNEDVATMPEDGNVYELIEGELFVSSRPGLTHQRLLVRLLLKINTCLTEKPLGEVILGPGVIFSEISGVIPDIVYISRDKISAIASTERITGAPDLVIEILSPGRDNEHRDRIAKRQLYAKYGVNEYWIVDAANTRIEVYTSPELILTTQFNAEDELTTDLLPGFRLSLATLFA